MRRLKIVFCIVACLFAAAAIPVGAIFGCVWFLALAVAAALAAGLMLFFKKRSDPKPPPEPDFMNSDEKNAEIRKQNEKNEPGNDPPA